MVIKTNSQSNNKKKKYKKKVWLSLSSPWQPVGEESQIPGYGL